MTKHITKPIRAIHFMVLAFLMALSSPVIAQDFQKGFTAYNAGDFATALQEWTPLAEAGDVSVQFNLGLMYNYGEGVLQDYKEAVKWFRLAAEQGVAEAQIALAVMYEFGDGVLQDNTMAHMWYNIASANGHDKAGGLRDERAGLMTNADISKAQAMARECMNSGYTKCGY